MNLFGKRQPEPPGVLARVEHLEAEIGRVSSALRQLEGEQILMHDQVRKWMRRAVAAERAAEREPDETPATVTPETPLRLSRRSMWGPRARRLARSAPVPDEPEESNGVHP